MADSAVEQAAGRAVETLLWSPVQWAAAYLLAPKIARDGVALWTAAGETRWTGASPA